MRPMQAIAESGPAGRGADAARRRRLIRRAALACAALVLAVTSLSAYLRLSKAGLSCDAWPACYGQELRAPQQGAAVAVEPGVATAAARLAHRVAASTVLLLVLLILGASVAARPAARREAAVALALLVLAVALAVLGRWSADARVPAVAIGNLLGGLVMFALAVRLATPPPAAVSTRLRAAAALGVALLLVQIALGGLASASFAATSCAAGAADCLARARELPWSALAPWVEPRLVGTAPPVNPSGALVVVLHALLGVALLPLLVALGAAAWRARRRAAGALLLAALALTAAIGAAMALGGTTLAFALAHNLLAALLLASAFALARGAGR